MAGTERAALEALRVERIDDLIPADERAEMNADLARMADQRRRVEAEGRCLPMA